MSVKISGTGLIGRNNENNITMNNDGSIFVGRGIVSPDSPLVADQNSKLPFEADKIIVSISDPNPAQGHENWLWFNVSSNQSAWIKRNNTWLQFAGGGGPSGGVPPGTVVYGAYQTVPEGWLICNGQSVSVAEYENLYAAIGNVFGGNATNFNVPDLRGQFLRGWDDGKGVDPGRAFGSAQNDMFANHAHSVTDPGHSHTVPGGDGAVLGLSGGSSELSRTSTDVTGITIGDSVGGGPENRPKNVALLPIIKI